MNNWISPDRAGPKSHADQSIDHKQLAQPSKANSQDSTTSQEPGGHLKKVLTDLETSAKKLRIAYDTLSQIGEVLNTIKAQSEMTASPLAHKERVRLVRSAVATIEDLVDHAEVDGKSLFRQGASSDEVPTGIHRTRANALTAYGHNNQLYLAHTTTDPPATKMILTIAKREIMGSAGILATLKETISSSEQVLDIDQLVNSVDGMLQSIQDADLNEIHPLRSSFADQQQPYSDPFSRSF